MKISPVNPYVNSETGKAYEPNPAEPGTIVASPWERCIVIGSKEYLCSECGIKVGLSPSSVAMLAKAPHFNILCIECLLKKTKSGEKP